MDIKYSIIPHVHWDREWYFTQQKSLLYLLHDMDEVIDTLENDESIRYFLFDAQTSLIDDYLKYHSHQADRLLKLIREKRILTGPWYTQCDQMIIHGESIVRNLLYGTKESADFGHCFRVGYAVDCFGQTAQMPQIYKGFGIPYTLFKRGLQTDKIPSSEFVWKSDDGSEVFAYHCTDYMNFRNPAIDGNKNGDTIKKITEAYKERSLTGNILLFNGFDQHPIRSDIGKIKKDLEKIFDINMEPLEDVLNDTFNNREFPSYVGELNSGETGRVHKSIYSSRADIKILNSKCENLFVKIIEPLQVLMHSLTLSEEKGLLKSLWKIMMENSAHDAIGTCNSDEVNRQIKARFLVVQDYLKEYEALSYRKIAKKIESDAYSFQVYNYLPYGRVENLTATVLSPYPNIMLQDSIGNKYDVEIIERLDVTTQIKQKYAFVKGVDGNYDSRYDSENIYRLNIKSVVKVPSMGYETYTIINSYEYPKKVKYLENEFLKVTINNNGTLTIFDKLKNYEYNEMLVIEDNADAGDSYDYSSTSKDRLITSLSSTIEELVIANNHASYQVALSLPKDLENRVLGLDEQIETIQVELSLLSTKPQIDFKLKVLNTATDHRLRIRFNASIPSIVSHADQSFGTIARPTYLPEVEKWKQNRWSEKPRTIEPMQSYVYLTDENRTVCLVTDSVKEYEITGTDFSQISYTLFRSFSKMGRPDLEDRPGRASGKEWETPDACLYGELETSFALCFPEEEEKCVDYANEYITPIRYHQEAIIATSSDEFILKDQEKVLPLKHSLLSLSGSGTKLSILKMAEDNNDYVLRTYQIEDGDFDILSNYELSYCGLDESNEYDFDKQKKFKRNEIVTVKMKRRG